MSGDAVALGRISGDADLVDVTAAVGEPADRAITCHVTLRNVTDAQVRVDNPYEGLTYHLISHTGTPVEVKAPPSAAKVRGPRNPLAKRSYIDVVAVSVDGAAQDADDFITSTSCELSPNGAIELALMIRSSIDPSDRAVLDEVPSGAYQLVVMVRTVISIGGDRHPLLLRTERDLDVTVG